MQYDTVTHDLGSCLSYLYIAKFCSNKSLEKEDGSDAVLHFILVFVFQSFCLFFNTKLKTLTVSHFLNIFNKF